MTSSSSPPSHTLPNPTKHCQTPVSYHKHTTPYSCTLIYAIAISLHTKHQSVQCTKARGRRRCTSRPISSPRTPAHPPPSLQPICKSAWHHRRAQRAAEVSYPWQYLSIEASEILSLQHLAMHGNGEAGRVSWDRTCLWHSSTLPRLQTSFLATCNLAI